MIVCTHDSPILAVPVMATSVAPASGKLNGYQPRFHCRVHERQNCDLPTSCQPAASFGNPEAKWTGVVRNISSGGLNLRLSRRFEPGTGLAIELGRRDADRPNTVLVKVVHVSRQE